MPLYSLSVCYQSFEGLLDRGKAQLTEGYEEKKQECCEGYIAE